MPTTKKINRSIVYIVLIVWTVLIIYPFIWTAFTSLKTNEEVWGQTWAPPSEPQWSNYVTAWTKGGLGLAMKNSAIITFGTLAILTLIAPMAAFFLSRKGLFGKSAVFYLLLMGMFVAPHSMMVPTYKLMSQVHLADSLLGLIVLYVASGLPYCIFIIRPSFLMIPKSLEESAKIDGLSTFKIYWRILFPLVKSALVVALILEGVFVWNDFFYPLLLLRTASKYTLPLCLYVFQGAHFIRYGPLGASILISAIPMVLLYVFLADQIRKGIAAQVGVKA